ncbi:MAG: DNA cytosine methyltransferase [Anaerolineaceae bacterium]|nr:DNA cytosine methyltransferase [Anaerolineaceae bacterium]
MKSINTLGLFSGGGGLDLGFSVAGYNHVYSSDIDPYSCKTLKINQRKKSYLNEHPVICEDIRNISHNSINKIIGNQDIDMIIGGPPCQAFSVFGKRKGLDDPRGDLVYEYARIIKEITPEAFVFENVAGLKTIHNGNLYNNLLEILSINGKYSVSAHEYDVANFGVPQFRRRIIFIGSKKNIFLPKMEPTHGQSQNSLLNFLQEYNKVGYILNDLPTPITDWKETPYLNGHIGRNHSDRIINRYKNLSFGERDPKTRINKLDPNKPSFTIIVGSDAGGGKGHVHPYEPREVTPRESARLQTFPDWWEFYGTGRHVIRQVGNAVPPLFAAVLADYIAKNIFESKISLKSDNYIDLLGLDFLKHDNKRPIQS